MSKRIDRNFKKSMSGEAEVSITKISVGVGSDYLKIEGSEEYVARNVGFVKEFISRSESIPSSEITEDLKGNADAQTCKAKQKKEKSETNKKLKSKTIKSERFDVHGGEDKDSLKKFFEEKESGNPNGVYIAIIGYYIQIILGEDCFSEGNVVFAYKHLKLKRPKALRQIMMNNKNSEDYYVPVDGMDQYWKLTRTGEIYVEDNLPSGDA